MPRITMIWSTGEPHTTHAQPALGGWMLPAIGVAVVVLMVWGMFRAKALVVPARLAGFAAAIAAIRAALPEGRPLPEEVWRAHHRIVVAVLWLHVPALLVVGLVAGRDLSATLIAIAPVALLATCLLMPGLGRRWASGLATLGLVTASAVLVHLTGGLIESHFHFFVVVVLASSYHDWVPLLCAVVFVVGEHGVVGLLAPHSVYNHADAAAAPWKWAGIHALFVAMASAASLLGWRSTERAQSAERTLLVRVAELARTCPLTGLANRRTLQDKLTELADGATREDSTVALLLLDLDDFKLINDSLGHAAGDELLIETARRLSQLVGEAGLAVRLGGDEFAVLLWGGDRDAAPRLAERIVSTTHEPMDISGRPVWCRASLGVAVAATADEITSVLRNADLAMYAAKAAGKGKIAFYSPDMLASVQQRLDLENHLRHAIERDELSLHYQPIVAAAGDEVVAVEALLRWHHPAWGLVPPAEFIPVAESSGAIVDIGAWVLDRACRDIATLAEATGRSVPVSINVSIRQLQDGCFTERVRRAVADAGIGVDRLTLEVTESLVMDEDLVAQQTLRDLAAQGVRLSLDDFGTGHSSLSRLRTLPFSELKIDRSFIAEVTDDGHCGPMVSAILAMARALDLVVVAEGVEREGQADGLRRVGCDAMQGYHFARPMPYAELVALSRLPKVIA